MKSHHYHEVFSTLYNAAYSTWVAKNREYGDNIEEAGALGAAVHIVGIAARLKPLVIRATDADIQRHQDAIANVVIDLFNYTTILAYMLGSDNLRGKDLPDDLPSPAAAVPVGPDTGGKSPVGGDHDAPGRSPA